MLSKTAMALVPAASLVGAAALAPTTSLAQLDVTTVSSPSTIPTANKTPPTASIGKALPPTRAPKERCTITASSSVAKVGE